MIQKLLIFIVIYLLSLPLIVTLTPFIFKQILNRIRRSSRQRTQVRNEEIKESYLRKAKPALKFVLKLDQRQTFKIKNKFIIIGLYLLGIALSVISAVINIPLLLLFAIILPFVCVASARIMFSPIKKGRESVLDKIYSLKRDRMGLVNKGRDAGSMDSEFEVLEWDKDYISPLRIKLFLPTSFDPIGEEAFMAQFNVPLSKGSAKWAADRTDPEDAGWNYNAGHVTIMRMPPLPSRAAWNEHYLLNDKIAWSFFPIALGVENGVKLHNDETGDDEFVLGFDVSGAQTKIKGVQVGAEVAQAPMVLIAGGTGGGKSLSVGTLIPTVVAVK